MQIKIENLKKKLALQQERVSFDLLAKSLASYPFAPKDVFESLKAKQSYKLIPLVQDSEDIAQIANKLMDEECEATFLQTNEDSALESLALMKRYSNLAIIRFDLIIDTYQILNSLIYGADAINLKANILDKKSLSELINFANQLGVGAIVEISNYDDLKKAIFARADIICIDEESCGDDKTLLKLLNSIPNNKVILLKTNCIDKLRFETLYKKGIDSFIVPNLMKD